VKIVVLIAALILSGCSRENGLPPRLELSDFAGEWVVKNYIDEVQRTRTPHQAWSPVPWALSFSVVKQGSGYEFNSTTLNEGGLSGAILRVEPTQQMDALLLVVAEREDQVLLRLESGYHRPIGIVRAEDSRGKSELFVRLPGTLDQYVNRIILAGKYRDRSGEEYSFDESGEARWPGKTFKYDISLNPQEAGCEYFQHDDSDGVGGRKRYGYRWNKEELELYGVNYIASVDCVICCDPKPFAILHRNN
jgi:hypothetical protein